MAELFLLSRIRRLAHENPTLTPWMKHRARAAGVASRRQLYVPLRRIPSHLKCAVLVSEDATFFEHGGIDVTQMRVALEQNLKRGRVIRGGSTITMQLARILFLWSGRSVARKVLELPIALQMEAILTKERILELYLNYVEWGRGLFGCQAASLFYFSKPCWHLKPEESALLAACLPNPGERNPAHPSGVVLWNQKRILALMQEREVLRN